MLMHFYHSMKCTLPMFMFSPVKDQAIVDIKTTSAKHSSIAQDLLAVHAISGADTLAALFYVGKNKVLKVAKKGLSLSSVGDPSADLETVEKQATTFVCASSGQAFVSCKSMTKVRIKSWRHRTACGSSTKLCMLPSTTEAFSDIKRYPLANCMLEKCSLWNESSH